MIIRKGFKYRLKPTKEQAAKFAQFCGCCRFVWNKALALQKERLDRGEFCLSYFDLDKIVSKWKFEEGMEFLGTPNAQSIGLVLKSLDRSLKDAFNKKSPKKFPRFKRRGEYDAFTVRSSLKVENESIFIAKIGWVKMIYHREIIGALKNATVSKNGDHWYVSIQVEYEVDEPIHPARSAVGIDVGIARFATLSDGSYYEPLNSFKKHEKRLARAQRRLSRKVKGSANWKKQVAKVRKIHSSIANARNDYLHNVSRKIVNENCCVVVEDLKVSNMSKSAAGTKEEPGRNVKAKSGLNKAILDQGWFNFRLMLKYKQEWLGGTLIAVDPKNTSRKCPNCGHTEKDNRKTQAKFECLACGFTENADLVGAMNILAAGLNAKEKKAA